MNRRVDVLIIGGGHNGLVAAAYLARAGKSVEVIEQLDHVGGAAISAPVFPGARISRYSYLVSLLPDQIVADLDLPFACRSRRVASFTPTVRGGRPTSLLVDREPSIRTAESFAALTGDPQCYDRWREFYGRMETAAQVIAPTLLGPLPTRSELRARLDRQTWDELIETPIGATIERVFTDDLVRGVVLTDALIGTFTSAHDANLLSNRCFLYHVIGNGTGEWKVPIGGMGALTDALAARTRAAGGVITCGATATKIETDGRGASVTVAQADGTTSTIDCDHVLVNAAPAELDRLLSQPRQPVEPGCQLKVNMLLTRLPHLACGTDPTDAFAGTFHIDEGYDQLDTAYQQARAGTLPTTIPGEVYCHSLTDPSILSGARQAAGNHTLTLFALHLPAALFDDDNDRVKAEACRSMLAGLNRYLAEPIEDCLAVDDDGSPLIEVHSPIDLEHELGLPRGNIFQRALSWPFRQDDEPVRWGVETPLANVLLCGAGAQRGGGVSGIPGYHAAARVLAAG